MLGVLSFLFALILVNLIAGWMQLSEDSLLRQNGVRAGGEASLVYDGKRAIDQQIYYHNLGNVVEEAKSADVLFLGNSRILCAMDPGVLESFSTESGVRFYNLGFGYDEGSVFAMRMIDKYRLRPKIVVVNCDKSFWENSSTAGKAALAGRAWKAWVDVKEFQLAWHLRRFVHRWIPKLVDPEKIAIWREHENGAWNLSVRDDRQATVSYVATESDDSLPSKYVKAVGRFRKAMELRGIQTVLTLVPSPMANATFAKQIARTSGMDLILVSSEEAFTSFDGDHLNDESSRKFTQLFLSQFEVKGYSEESR